MKLVKYNIKDISSHSVARLNYWDPPVDRKASIVGDQEKVSFWNKVDEDLIVEYKGYEAPPTERFFDTHAGTREETKQSLNNKLNDNRKTSREINNTDSSLYDFNNTKGNHSYISDQSVHILDINKTDNSYLFPNTTDSMDINNKVNLNMHYKAKLTRRKRRSRRRKEKNKISENDIKISSLIKRKGQNRNLGNFLSIKESNFEVDQNSGDISPYYSSNVKNIKSNLNGEISQISDNPLASVNAFQKKLSQVPQKLDDRFEMNIQEVHDQSEDRKAQRSFAKLHGMHKSLMSMSLKNSLINKKELDEFDISNGNIQESKSKLIFPSEGFKKSRYSDRKSRFEETCRQINSISLHRKSSKTPDLKLSNSDKERWSPSKKSLKWGSRKMSFGVWNEPDLPTKNFDSLDSDKGSILEAEKEYKLSWKAKEGTGVFSFNTSGVLKHHPINKKMRMYSERREDSISKTNKSALVKY